MLLDASVIQLGAKIKVAMAIAASVEFKLDRNSLHSVISHRNAFAHQPTNSHPVWVIGKEPEEKKGYYQIQVITQSGKIEAKLRQDALRDFNKSYDAAKQSVLGLLERVKSLSGEEKP